MSKQNEHILPIMDIFYDDWGGESGKAAAKEQRNYDELILKRDYISKQSIKDKREELARNLFDADYCWLETRDFESKMSQDETFRQFYVRQADQTINLLTEEK